VLASRESHISGHHQSPGGLVPRHRLQLNVETGSGEKRARAFRPFNHDRGITGKDVIPPKMQEVVGARDAVEVEVPEGPTTPGVLVDEGIGR
jgi:hypothetical protein